VVGVGLGGARVVGGDQQRVVRNEPRRHVDDVGVVDEEAGTPEALEQLVADVLVVWTELTRTLLLGEGPLAAGGRLRRPGGQEVASPCR